MGENARVVEKSFSGRGAVDTRTVLSAESEAALRQFSLERVTAYGVAYADAIELRGRVTRGEDWQAVATDLAATALSPPEQLVAVETIQTRSNRLFRASALTRMRQMMMLTDTDERREIFATSATLFAEAVLLKGDCERALIPSAAGPMAGWFHAAKGTAIGATIVIGGVEGWAMDFAPLGVALAARGVSALLLDGPGQGETRLQHRHHLSNDWPQAYRAAVNHLVDRTGGVPIGFIGNSLGGTVAVKYASLDDRIAACCDNGGPLDPGRARGNATFFRKMVAHCGGVADDQAYDIWRTIQPPGADAPLAGPLLVVHGGLDPLIPYADAAAIHENTIASDKLMVVFSDGDHCVYNHADDKHDMIADWMADRLGRAIGQPC